MVARRESHTDLPRYLAALRSGAAILAHLNSASGGLRRILESLSFPNTSPEWR